ncbi:MAG: hypothetical protein HY660_15210, partial [Armatimonadetes bacterium]|nr:hypothetical protein [Armatimonadota bacterium]
MDISTVVFGGLAAALVVYSLRNGGPAHAAAGLRSGLVLFIETVPRLLLGFI